MFEARRLLISGAARRAARWGAALIASLTAILSLAAPASAAPGAVITVNYLVDAAPADDGACTLREAIIAANTNTASGATAGECPAGKAGLDRIEMGYSDIITLGSDLPPITRPVKVNGFGAVALEGASVVANGFQFYPGSKGSTLNGFLIINFEVGVRLTGGGVTLTNNWIGTLDGGTEASNGIGVRIESSNNRIGLVDSFGMSQGNLISGNLSGVVVVSGSKNTIQANRIGTTAGGLSALSNVSGINIAGGSSTLIGGAKPGQGNIISGNTAGIAMFGPAVKNTRVMRNVIGLGSDLTTPVANAFGIRHGGAVGTVIGGAMPAASNFITSNTSAGIQLLDAGGGDSGKITITGNLIGAAGDGSQYGNGGDGIRISDAAAKLKITNNAIWDSGGSGIANTAPTFVGTISGNCFDGNTTGASNGLGAPVKAAKNWWGDASGPFHPVSNPLAYGDQVSDNVVYKPWLKTSPTSCLGFAPKNVRPKGMAFGPKSAKPAKFTWGKVPTASSYAVYLEGISSGVIANNVSTGKQTKYTSPAPLDYDAYGWWITTYTADGVAWLNWQHNYWTTILQSPKPDSTTKSTTVKFTWGKYPGAASYTWTQYDGLNCVTVGATLGGVTTPRSAEAMIGSGFNSWSVTPNNGPAMPCWNFQTP